MKIKYHKITALFVALCITTSSFANVFSSEKDSSLSAARAFSNAFVTAAKMATPAVVFIKAEISQEYGYQFDNQDPNDPFGDDFFNRFFGGPPQRRNRSPQPQVATGSGFFLSKDGYIMTNYHVVKNAKKIYITTSNGKNKELNAIIVGGDPQTDLAVLKIDDDESPEDFPYLEFGNSEDLQVGEWVIAVGNPFQLESTVTAGVISAKGRQDLQINDLEDFIQTDAAVNPGNSGGPLMDLEGKVIGVNTAIVSKSGGYMGISFAVPSDIAKNIYKQVVETGSVSRGFLGVSLQPIDKELAEAFQLKGTEGALIADVVPDSPAEKAGLKTGDIVIALNRTPIKSAAHLRNDVMLLEPGTKITLTILRDNKEKKINVTLGNIKDQKAGSYSEIAEKIGFSVENITPETIKNYYLDPKEQGVIINEVKKGSMAYRAGLKPGFLIMAVNHQKIVDTTEFNEALQNTGASNRALLLVKQGDSVRFYSFKIN